ncbi:MAG: hypothetical protein RLZZ292_3858 [Bacteroidota bacterium]
MATPTEVEIATFIYVSTFQRKMLATPTLPYPTPKKEGKEGGLNVEPTLSLPLWGRFGGGFIQKSY